MRGLPNRTYHLYVGHDPTGVPLKMVQVFSIV